MELTGIGLYTFGEASKLTRIPVRNLRRWLEGHAERHGTRGTSVYSPPLWTSELAGELSGMSFHDLLESRFVQAFRRHGVSLQAIRAASRRARELFGMPYPFTSRRFQTDGRTLFASAPGQAGQRYAFNRLIEPSLYCGIEFDQHDAAMRWYPTPDKAIVLDPKVAFGKPIVTGVNVRTSILHDAFVAEGNKSTVAALYEVPLAAVNAAVAFEEGVAA